MISSRSLYWSYRRELWESRSVWVAPLAVAALALFGFLISVVQLPAKIRATAPMDGVALRGMIRTPYEFAAGLLMFTTLLVAVFYAIDALYGERRDRSILFWKSLPVSDASTVLVKASIPIFLLPLISFVLTLAVQLAMAVLSSMIIGASGLSVAAFWDALGFGEISSGLLYHLIAVHGLSWAPFFGWMLFVSAWAKRAPFVWAVVPPLAIAIVERIAFNTSHFGAMVAARFAGSDPAMGFHRSMTHVPNAFFSTPGLWIGMLVTAAFLAAAVRLRRYQTPV